MHASSSSYVPSPLAKDATLFTPDQYRQAVDRLAAMIYHHLNAGRQSRLAPGAVDLEGLRSLGCRVWRGLQCPDGAGPQSMKRGLNDENGRTACAPWPSVRMIIRAF